MIMSLHMIEVSDAGASPNGKLENMKHKYLPQSMDQINEESMESD